MAVIRRLALSAAAVACLLLAAEKKTSPPPANKPGTKQKNPGQKTTAAGKAKTAGTKKRSTRRRTARRPPLPSIPRQAAIVQVHDALSTGEEVNGSFEPVDNPAGLIPFFERLHQLKNAAGPAVHVLHYGDSHTASDDMPAALRQAFQADFGDGGPGFAMPGRPFAGYRRYDLRSTSSRGWTTEGVMRNRGDGLHGLGGVSLTASRMGETVTLSGEAEEAELYYLQQPGGGNLDIWLEDTYRGTISTDGELRPAAVTLPGEPGPRRYLFRTSSPGPVRLLGTVFQNSSGVTWETFGINGASAGMIGGWDESLLAAQIAARDPALIVLAYGTNESNTRRWDGAAYEASLRAVLGRLRGQAPAATLLLIGPPDYFTRTPRILAEIVEIQRRVAIELRCAFWNWRERMGGEGSMRAWYYAGLAQRDLIHFNRAGYQLAGKTLHQDLMHLFERFLRVRLGDEPRLGGSAAGFPVGPGARPLDGGND